FPVMQYGTTLNGLSTVGLNMTAGYQGYLVDSNTVKTVYLILTNGPIQPTIIWNGTVNGDWDVFTANWKIGLANTNYVDDDVVRFTDAATGTKTVNLTTLLAPGDTYVSNSVTYTFTGTGGIVGTNRLFKDGSGTLILDNSGNNGYSGGTTINAGTMQVGNNNANGSIGSGNIANNGLLVINHNSI